MHYGPKAKFMAYLYKGIVRPALSYGCHVWAHNLTMTTKAKFKKLNRLACLGCTRVARSTPTSALELLHDIEPLDIFLERTAVSMITRIKNLINIRWDGIGQTKNRGHIRHWLNTKDKMSIPMLRPNRPWQRIWTKYYDIKEHPATELPAVWYAFTDGSRHDDQTGYGFVIRRDQTTTFATGAKLKDENSVFQAEVRAVQKAAEYLIDQVNLGDNVVFRIDSQSAIAALTKTETNDPLLMECMISLNKLGTKANTTLAWIKAHVGHYGNELADTEAKLGASSGHLDDGVAIPDSYGRY